MIFSAFFLFNWAQHNTTKRKRNQRNNVETIWGKLNCSSWFMVWFVRLKTCRNTWAQQFLKRKRIKKKREYKIRRKDKKKKKEKKKKKKKAQEIGFFSGSQWMDSIVELKGYWRWQSARSFDSLFERNEGRLQGGGFFVIGDAPMHNKAPGLGELFAVLFI